MIRQWVATVLIYGLGAAVVMAILAVAVGVFADITNRRHLELFAMWAFSMAFTAGCACGGVLVVMAMIWGIR